MTHPLHTRLAAAAALAIACTSACAQAGEFDAESALRVQLSFQAQKLWGAFLPAGSFIDRNQTFVLDAISPLTGPLEPVRPWKSSDQRAPATSPETLGATLVANCGSGTVGGHTLKLQGKALQTVKVRKNRVLSRRTAAVFSGAQVFPDASWPQAMRVDFNGAQTDVGSELRPFERSHALDLPARQVRVVELVGHRLTSSTVFSTFNVWLRPAAATPVSLTMRALGMACANIKYYTNTTLLPKARQCISSGETVNFEISDAFRHVLTLLEVSGGAVVDLHRQRDARGDADTVRRTTEFDNLDNGYRSMRVHDAPALTRSSTWGHLAQSLGSTTIEFSMPLGSLDVDLVTGTRAAAYAGDRAMLDSLCAGSASGVVERPIAAAEFTAARAAGRLQSLGQTLP